LRDDYSGGTAGDGTIAKLEPALDRVVMMNLDQSTNEVKANLYNTGSDSKLPDPLPDPPDGGTTSLDEVLSMWEGGSLLAKRGKNTRNVYLWIDEGAAGVQNGDFSSISGEAKKLSDSDTTLR
ncbi:MAG: hypothetical protein GWN87_26570, partial [Desulfuromonadales bacterium]|nr:hypothetical protein [Desulfuromonadales bacterium]NIS43309.1 hypothetical protein [Desulfuromonadales bacterium]